MKTQKVINEFNELKKDLKDFYNQCYANALIYTSEYRISSFGFDGDNLYVSLSYLLTNFEHQTKLFYNYLIKNNLNIFNINVVFLHQSTFGFLSYKIDNNFINYDLLFDALNDIYNENDENINCTCIDFTSFYAMYVLNHPEIHDVNNCTMSCFISDFIYTVSRECLKLLDSEHNGPMHSRENFLTTSCDEEILSKNHSLFLENSSLYSAEPSSFDFVKSTYLSKLSNTTNIMTSSSIAFNDIYNSFDEKNICIRNHIQILSIVDDILKNVSFTILDKKSDEITKMINNQIEPFNYYQRIRSMIESVLIATSSYLDNINIFESHLKEAFNEIDENMQNQSFANKHKTDIKKWCSSFFIKQNNFQDLNTLLQLSKKFLVELPNFIENLNIDYSPMLVQLII